MIEEDIVLEKPFPAKDTMSILHFCQFLHDAHVGLTTALCILPHEHQEFYHRIVRRLVIARELPARALLQFEASFFQDESRSKERVQT